MNQQQTHRDETFNRALKFVNNHQKLSPGVSNIYVFTTRDRDGNIVDEKYGMNLMTNYGFKTLYQGTERFDAASNAKLYVGEGTGTVSITDTALNSQCFGGLAASNTDTTWDYRYPIYYAEGNEDGTGLITLISRFLICSYDYNIQNYPDPVRISEYGIGSSATALWTHARVYADDGSLADIIKNPNEKLTITVYMCLSFYESLIQNGWSNGIFTAITSNRIMYHRMYEDYTYTYKRNNIKAQRSALSNPFSSTIDQYHTMDTTADNAFTNSTIMPPFTMYDGTDNTSGYIDGFIFYSNNGLIIVEPQALDTPEDIVLENFYSIAPARYTGFAEKFGTYPSNASNYTKEQYPPITHLTDVTVDLYDWKTKSWSNRLSIYNPDNKYYTETPAQTTCGLPIYYSNKGEIITGYLYQNLHPEDKIIGITGGGITVYATNKYWANSTREPWIWIQDFSNIPEAAQTARFWITASNTDSLQFVRESDNFQLLEAGGTTPADNGYDKYNEFDQLYGCYPYCDNYEYGWYMRDNKVYVPATRRMYTVGNSGTTATESMTYGRYLITFNSVNNQIIITDMNDAKTGGTVTPTNTAVPFSSNVNSLTECYRTQSETGLICMQSTKSGAEECVVIDMRGNNVSLTKYDWKMSCCIWGTNKIAYVPAGSGADSKYIYIYNMETESLDGDRIPFPNNISSVPFMFGHTDYVWFTDGATHAHVVNINDSERIPVGYEDNINYSSNLYQVKITAVDDVFIVYKYSEYNNTNKAHYIRLDNVESPLSLGDFEWTSDYLNNRIDFTLRYVHRYTSNNIEHGSIALLLTKGYYNSSASGNENGSYNALIDFGQYMATGSAHRWYQYGNNLSNYHFYGENIIYRTQQKCPLANFMPIKLVGKSDTIGTLNYTKRISNKSWTIGYTNLPTWGPGTSNQKGVPPGVPIANTDGNGAITGWS